MSVVIEMGRLQGLLLRLRTSKRCFSGLPPNELDVFVTKVRKLRDQVPVQFALYNDLIHTIS